MEEVKKGQAVVEEMSGGSPATDGVSSSASSEDELVEYEGMLVSAAAAQRRRRAGREAWAGLSRLARPVMPSPFTAARPCPAAQQLPCSGCRAQILRSGPRTDRLSPESA